MMSDRKLSPPSIIPEGKSGGRVPTGWTDDGVFIQQRVMGIRDPDKVEHALHQAVLDLLDSDIELSRCTRTLIRGELDRLWHRDLRAERRYRRAVRAAVIRAELDAAIAQKRQAGSKAPVTEA